jgi:nucleoside phosphorylase/tetratricopeptide (TPR) repeat protein
MTDATTDRHYDVALLVPLDEEFGYVTEVLPSRRSFEVRGNYYHELDVPGSPYSVVAHIIGDMGLNHATLAAERMIDWFQPGALGLVGLAGSLSDDLLLGDVVIATQVDAYLQAAKAVPGPDDDHFEFTPAGEVWQAPFALTQFIRNFRHRPELRHLYTQWQQDAAARRETIHPDPDPTLVRREPVFDLGPIASGDVVGAAQAFSRWLRRRNRKLAAIEMEAGGVATATHSRTDPRHLLVVRGISDFADERKSALDALRSQTGEQGVWRRYAVHNAARLLQAFLRSGEILPTQAEVVPRPAARASRSRGARSQPGGDDPASGPRGGRFVGAAPNHTLRNLLRWLTEPAPIFLVQGFSGIGKSRLARELSARAPQPWTTIWVDDTPSEGIEPLLLDLVGSLDHQGLTRRLVPGANLMLGLQDALRKPVIIVLDEFQNILPEPGSNVDRAGVQAFLQHVARRRGRGKLLLLSNRSYPDWLSEYPIDTLTSLSGEEGTQFVKQMLADRGVGGEPDDARLTEVVNYLGGNPRALEVLASFLVSDPLDALVGLEPAPWEVTDRVVDPELVERLEERIVRRIVSRVAESSQEMLHLLSVHRRPFDLDAITALPLATTTLTYSRRELVASFLMEQRRSGWYALHPIAQRIALERLSRQPAALRTAHDHAGAYYARHFKAKQVQAIRNGRNFIDARYHLVHAGRGSELRTISTRYVLYLERAYARAPVPREPDALAERIAVLVAAAHEATLSPELYHHLAKLLFTRGRTDDPKLALGYLEDAVRYLKDPEAWSLFLRLRDRVDGADGVDGVVSAFRQGFARVESAEARLHLYHVAADLLGSRGAVDTAGALGREFLGELESAPGVANAYLRATGDLARTGDLPAATELALQAVARLDPQHGLADAYRNAVELLARAGELDPAIRLAQEAVGRVAPDARETFQLLLVDLLRRAGQIDAAIALVRATVAGLGDDWGEPWLTPLARLLVARGDLDGAAALVRRALARYHDAPTRIAIGAEVVRTMADAGAATPAFALGTMILDAVAPHEDLVLLLYRHLIKLAGQTGNVSQALGLGYQGIDQLATEPAVAHLYRDTMALLVRTGNPEEAIALGRQGILALEPSAENGLLYHDLMALLARRGDLAAAIALGSEGVADAATEQVRSALYRDLVFLSAHRRDPAGVARYTEAALSEVPPGPNLERLCHGLAEAEAFLNGWPAAARKLVDCCRRARPADPVRLLVRALAYARIAGEWSVAGEIDSLVADHETAGQLRTLAAVMRAQADGEWAKSAALAREVWDSGPPLTAVVFQGVYSLLCAGRTDEALHAASVHLHPANLDNRHSSTRSFKWHYALTHWCAGDQPESNRFLASYLGRELTAAERDNRHLIFDLWRASAAYSGGTPALFYPWIPRTLSGLAEDLRVGPGTPPPLSWPYLATGPDADQEFLE